MASATGFDNLIMHAGQNIILVQPPIPRGIR